MTLLHAKVERRLSLCIWFIAGEEKRMTCRVIMWVFYYMQFADNGEILVESGSPIKVVRKFAHLRTSRRMA